MKQKKEITRRLNELVEAVGTNANRLSKDVGGTTTKYYKLLSGDTIPNWETITSILEVYPSISAEWLIRGIGPMIKNEGPEYHKLVEENSNLKNEVQVLEKMLRSELMGKKFKATLLSPDLCLVKPFRKESCSQVMRSAFAR